MHLDVKDGIHYVLVGSEECASQNASGTQRVPCAASVEEVVSEDGDEAGGDIAAGGVDDEEEMEEPVTSLLRQMMSTQVFHHRQRLLTETFGLPKGTSRWRQSLSNASCLTFPRILIATLASGVR